MMGKYEAVKSLFGDFDYSAFWSGRVQERVSILPAAPEYILSQPEGKNTFMQAVLELSRAYSLVATTDEARSIRDEIGFFQGLRVEFLKTSSETDTLPHDHDLAGRPIVEGAVLSDAVVDIFAATGVRKPNIGILHDEFLAQMY